MRTRRKRTRRSVAQSMVEYAIVAALVAVVAIVAIRTLGSTVQGIFSNINTQVETVKPDNRGTTTHSPGRNLRQRAQATVEMAVAFPRLVLVAWAWSSLRSSTRRTTWSRRRSRTVPVPPLRTAARSTTAAAGQRHPERRPRQRHHRDDRLVDVQRRARRGARQRLAADVLSMVQLWKGRHPPEPAERRHRQGSAGSTSVPARNPRNRAQAVLELALVLPLLLLLAFGAVGVGRVIQAQMALSAVAREAARQAALSPLPQAARPPTPNRTANLAASSSPRATVSRLPSSASIPAVSTLAPGSAPTPPTLCPSATCPC